MTGWFAIAGRSMWPLAAPFEARVEPVGARSLQVGDVIAFVGTRPGAVFVHRVTAIEGGRIATRGDTNRRSDAEFGPDAIVGRVAAVRWRWRIRSRGSFWPRGIGVAWPRTGVGAAAWRQAGRLWSRIAPPCFDAARRVRRTVAQT